MNWKRLGGFGGLYSLVNVGLPFLGRDVLLGVFEIRWTIWYGLGYDVVLLAATYSLFAFLGYLEAAFPWRFALGVWLIGTVLTLLFGVLAYGTFAPFYLATPLVVFVRVAVMPLAGVAFGAWWRRRREPAPKQHAERAPGKIAALFITAFVVILIPNAASGLTLIVHPIVVALDPDGAFLRQAIHHGFLLLLTVHLLMIFQKPMGEWRFKLTLSRSDLALVGGLCLMILVLMILVRLPGFLSGNPPMFEYPLTARNMIGAGCFHFLVSGVAEEPLFRGFVMIFLAQSWQRVYRIGRVDMPVSGLWATLFFMIAHLDFTVGSFAVRDFSWSHQGVLLGMGLINAVLFHRTQSLVAPVLFHNLFNGIMLIILYLAAFF